MDLHVLFILQLKVCTLLPTFPYFSHPGNYFSLLCFFEFAFFWVHMVSGTVRICLSLCCSVAQSCLTLCNPMDCSTPISPVLHYLPEFAQTHVHWIIDAIQPTHPLLPSSPLSSIFPSIRVFFNELALCIRWPKYWHISISPFKEYSGLISFRIDWFEWLIFLLSKGRSAVISSTIIWKHQFLGAQLSLWSNSHIHTWLLEKS